MGTLCRIDTEKTWALPAWAILGRGADCAVQVADPRVSGEHASLSWRDGCWVLRDLASRNGTFVDGNPLQAGSRVPLSLGSRFSVGGTDVVLELCDATGPGAAAVAPDGTRVAADGGVLLLPDAESARVAVVSDEHGTWTVESEDGEEHTVQDGEVIEVDGERWVLALPRELPPTVTASATEPRLAFRVSLDEEHTEMKVLRVGTTHTLPSRSFTYMLLTLARMRLDHKAEGRSERECGWVDQEQLASDLRVDPTTISVYVHRARRQVGRIGDGLAKGLIERRLGTRQLRLGLPVERIDRG